MKILFCCGTLNQGGAERVISILASELSKQGHEVEVLLYYKSDICFEFPNDVKISFDEDYIGESSFIKHIYWRRDYIRKSTPDIVLSFLAPFNMINIIATLGLKVPIIVADRNDPRKVPRHFLIRQIRNLLYTFADGIVLQNNSNKNYFSKRIIEKSCVISNPLNLGCYTGAALNVKDKKKEIVSVARVIRQKNPLMLLKAFNEIKDEFPEHKLVYYGSGDLISDLKNQAKKMGISQRVCLNGGTKDVFKKIYKADLFVLTSDYEGMPNALMEAMCIGLPVISTKVSGAKDMIRDGSNGFLVECNDYLQLASKMRILLSNSDLKFKFGKEAVELYKNFDTNIIINQWMSFMKEKIDETHGFDRHHNI